MTKGFLKGALAGVAMLGATEAMARCDVTVTNVAANGVISVQRDVYINNSLSSRWSGPYQYNRNLSATQQAGAPQLTQYFLNRSGVDGTSRATSGVSHVTQRVVDDICRRAFDRITVPEVRIPERPVQPVTPPRQVTPPREVATPPRQVATPPRQTYAPPVSVRPQPRPEPVCTADEVQPVVIIEVPCDCGTPKSFAEGLRNVVPEFFPGVEVLIVEESVRGEPTQGVQFRVSVQDTQDGPIEIDLTASNSDRFRVTEDGDIVNIEDGANFQAVAAYMAEELQELGYVLPTAAPAAATADADTAAPARPAPVMAGALCTPR